ncbi:class I SAM-dependent methyltransferase [Thermanaerothrix sp.]|uniref:class I SAM-dependent methyltransferase n=1 Tax=Thermanaerothrix sp. TaxID=2972675 RepID=UPI003C7C0A78
MPNNVDLLFWHQRFLTQAGWSAQIRQHLLKEIGNHSIRRILEVGCGTGAVLSDSIWEPYLRYGLDIQFSFLSHAKHLLPSSHLCQGDGYNLPFAANTFDLCYTHYFFLWVNPAHVMRELMRVTRPGGFIAALAEPDYGGRIDYPSPLEKLGQLQITAIQKAGGDPFIGRKLASLFSNSGLINLHIGVFGAYWKYPPDLEIAPSEWLGLRLDLQSILPAEDIDHWQALDLNAWEKGERVLFVPTFFAYAQKP